MKVLVAEPLAEEGVELLRAGHEVDVRTDLDRDGAEVSDAEDPARQLALASRKHEALVTQAAVQVAPLEAVRNVRGGDGVRREPGIREQLETEGIDACARGGAARRVTREDLFIPLGLDDLERHVEGEADADGRRPWRLALGQAVAMGREIEVEAGHRRLLVGRPRARRHAEHRKARRNHPALL